VEESLQQPGRATRVGQVDAIKAIAIFLVLVDHSLSDQIVYSTWGMLHIAQAVPVFMVLIGYAGQWGTVHRRLVRLLVPFVILWLASLALALAHGEQPVGWMTLVGYLPYPGPGNFFIPIVFCICLLLPVLRWLAGRSSLLLLLVTGAVDLGFELAAPHIRLFTEGHPFYYSEAFPRYLLAVGFGFWLAKNPRLRWVVPLGLASLAYLVTSRLAGWQPPFLPDWGADDLLGVGYSTLLVALGLRFLPAKPPLVVSAIGQATYHIFLFQILLFSIIRDVPMSWRWTMGLTIPLIAGVLWLRLEAPLMRWLSPGRPPARPAQP
jgi:fucose 4-O-acetylase-like acetyltransferase